MVKRYPMTTVCCAQAPAIEVNEERERIRQVALGDSQAFAWLVTRYSPPVYRFMKRMLNSIEDAEDLTQETFYEVSRRRESLRHDADILPYLFTIARNKAISLIRWRTVRRCLVPLTHEHDDTVSGSSASPVDEFQKQQTEQAVNKALASLAPNKRAVLIMRFFENMPYREIAIAMNKPEGTVKSLAFRAERELREKLAGLNLDRQGE